jgi:hypothetical protein
MNNTAPGPTGFRHQNGNNSVATGQIRSEIFLRIVSIHGDQKAPWRSYKGTGLDTRVDCTVFFQMLLLSWAYEAVI